MLLTEAATLGSLRHPNIVAFLGVCLDTPAEPMLVTEFVGGGSLDLRLPPQSARPALRCPSAPQIKAPRAPASRRPPRSPRRPRSPPGSPRRSPLELTTGPKLCQKVGRARASAPLRARSARRDDCHRPTPYTRELRPNPLRE